MSFVFVSGAEARSLWYRLCWGSLLDKCSSWVLFLPLKGGVMYWTFFMVVLGVRDIGAIGILGVLGMLLGVFCFVEGGLCVVYWEWHVI